MLDGLTREQVEAWAATLTEEEIEAEHGLLDADDAHRAAHPLAYVRLWDRPKPHTSQLRAARMLARSKYLLVAGGNRCLAGETLVRMGDGTERRLDGVEVGDRVQTPAGPCRVSATFRKGPDPLFRVELSSGRAFLATLDHRVLTDGGWRAVRDLSPGQVLSHGGGRHLLGSGACRPQSSGDTCRSVHDADDQRCFRTTPSSRCGCPACHHSCGEPPPRGRGAGQDGPPSPAGAQARGPLHAPSCGEGWGASGPTTERSHPCRSPAPPSSRDAPAQALVHAEQTGSRASCTTSRSSGVRSQVAERTKHGSGPRPRSMIESAQSASLAPSATPLCVVSIAPDRTDYHYDLTVPGPDCYEAEGAIHHNSGKTELGAIVAACVLKGRNDPDVLAFCDANGIDPEVFPAEPARVWCSALSFGDSLEYQRPKLEKYIPEAEWSGRYREGRCEARLPNGSVAVFKSDDQGREKFQGGAVDLLWLDEEHSRKVWDEARMRLIDKAGRAVLTMTPLKGLTWVYDQFVDLQHEEHIAGAVYAQLSIRDNPHLSGEAIDLALSGKGRHELAARERGEFTALEGRIYDGWRRDLHVVEALPDGWEEWEPYAAIDFGTRNPFAYVLALLDPDDRLWIVGEVYRRQLNTRGKAEEIEAIEERWGVPVMRWADPEDRGARMDLASEHGIDTVKARKDVRAGINAVAERLEPNADGEPSLYVLEGCGNLIREIESYVWAERNTKSDQAESPLKRDDHLMDALRYLCYGLSRSLALLGG